MSQKPSVNGTSLENTQESMRSIVDVLSFGQFATSSKNKCEKKPKASSPDSVQADCDIHKSTKDNVQEGNTLSQSSSSSNEIGACSRNEDFNFSDLTGMIADHMFYSLNLTEQFSLDKNVIVIGVPEHSSEDTDVVVCKIAMALGMPLNQDDIDFSHRFGRKDLQRLQGRPIIVRFVRKRTRDQLLNKAKLFGRSLSPSDLGLGKNGTNSKIYLNEQLTKYNRKLFQRIKTELADEKQYYVWLSDGKIYVRKCKGAYTERIKSWSDFEVFKIGVLKQ